MRIKCEYCNNYIDDSDEKCPYCSAPNNGIKRTGTGVPKTIEELKHWYIDHNLPDENTTRFFIGRDYAGPRAFGIFKDETTGNFIVYKNKSDGTRATRYSGKDEAYAVNELYMKLKEEMMNQQSRSSSYRSSDYPRSNISAQPQYTSNNSKGINAGIVALIIIIVMIILCSGIFAGGRGFYSGGGYSGYSGYSSYYYNDNSYSYSSDYGGSSSSNSSSWSSSWDDSSWDSSWDSSSSWDSDFGSWDSDW